MGSKRQRRGQEARATKPVPGGAPPKLATEPPENVEVDELLQFASERLRQHVTPLAVHGPSTAELRYRIPRRDAEGVLRAYEAMFGHQARDASWIDIAYRLELALFGLRAELRDFHRENVDPADLRARYRERAVLVRDLPTWITDEDLQRLLDATELGHAETSEPPDAIRKAINAAVNALANRARKAEGLPPLDPTLHRLEAEWPRGTVAPPPDRR